MQKETHTNEQTSSNSKNPIISKVSESVKQINIDKLEKIATVVKRNGRIVPFHKERIQTAIELAFRDSRNLPKPQQLSSEIIDATIEITQIVVNQLLTMNQKGVALTVEGIQDLVEITLMKNGYHDVARGYIIYRDKHSEQREDSIHNIKLFRFDESSQVRAALVAAL